MAFSLDDVLKQDSFSEVKGVVGKAKQRHIEEAKTKLEDKLVEVVGQVEQTLDSEVREVRRLKQQLNVQKARVTKVGRAKDYFEETGNPLPFYRELGLDYLANNFCVDLGVPVPEQNDKLWSVPSDWSAS